MFDNNIKTEPIPERVYELCKMVSKGDIDDSVARERMEPSGLNKSEIAYYPSIRAVCIQELKLIENKDGILRYVGDKNVVRGLETFRMYCNSVVFNNPETYFYRIIQCYLESNDLWLKYKTLTDPSIIRNVQDKSKIASADSKMMLGTRFWVAFLGFGYIQEGDAMFYLPNMHIALQDYCELSGLEKEKEYSVREFVDEIYGYASVALKDVREKRMLNLAISNALRQMHDCKEIVLKNNSDSKEIWQMFKDNTHEFTSKITHIVYKGVKRE